MKNNYETSQVAKFSSNIAKLGQDFKNAIQNWRICCLIGINDIRKRYARSKLGQFWLTLSLAVNVTAIGLVWAYLFKIPVKDYIVFLSFGSIFWQYMSLCVNEGANIFIVNTAYLKELRVSKTTYIFSLFIKNIIILYHNLIIMVPLYFFFPFNVNFKAILFALFSIIAATLFLFPIIMIISLIGLRFRDFPNIVVSLTQILFYLTPIMWKIELMPAKFHQYILLNPAAIFITIFRDTFFNMPISANYFLAAFAYIIVSWILALIIFSKYRARINYWL